MVTKREVLEELTLPKLKKIARELGIQVRKGVTGFLSERYLGREMRGPYIEALTNSRIATLEEMDRILDTNFSGMRPPRESKRDMEEMPPRAIRPKPESPQRESRETQEEEPGSIVEHVLARYLYKEDVQEICDELDLPVSGSKEDLIERIIADDDFSPEAALAYVDKEGLKALCEELDLRTGGTREDLERRILEAIAAEESAATSPESRAAVPPTPPTYIPPTPATPPAQAPSTPQAPRPPLRRELFAPQPMEPPLEFPEVPAPTLIPEPKAPQIAQLQMVAEFIDAYRPSQRFRNEQAYEIEIAQAMRHHFGAENVKTQANIPGGRIDIEVLGIGVEIKVPASRGQLQTLLGQVSIYRNYYGPNLIIVVFNDFAKVQDVNEFCNILRGRGIQVFVK